MDNQFDDPSRFATFSTSLARTLESSTGRFVIADPNHDDGHPHVYRVVDLDRLEARAWASTERRLR